MGESSSHKTAYLALDELVPNPRLARRLPADLAWRFHALPLAEDHGRVTVAMANPDDAEAREAVVTALGAASCVVQGDPATIDTLLAEIWGDEACRPMDLRVCDFPDPVADEVWDYAQALGDLLSARVSRLSTAGAIDALTERSGGAECDMVIFQEPDHPLIRRLLRRAATGGASTSRGCSESFAVLTARRPRWPLGSILLVLLGEETDEAAVDWVVRLARHSGSAVTALAVVPPVPAMYSRRVGMDQGLPVLLTSATPLGRQMRRVARHLAEWEIEGTLRLRQGPPDWQICREIVKGDHDLVALAAKPRPWWWRWLEADLLGTFLRWVDCPVLVAKPTNA